MMEHLKRSRRDWEAVVKRLVRLCLERPGSERPAPGSDHGPAGRRAGRPGGVQVAATRRPVRFPGRPGGDQEAVRSPPGSGLEGTSLLDAARILQKQE